MTTILLVDDDPHILRSLKASLLTNGHRTIDAPDGPTALVLFSEHRTVIDIIVTDYHMPEMTGLELLHAIREHDNTTPFILMTAYGNKKIVINALQHQCEGFIEKPFTGKELLAEIERIQQARADKQPARNVAQLLPRVVHQINNPLHAISGHAQLSLLQIGDEKALKKNLNLILQAANMIGSINRDIMQLGKHAAGLKHQRFNLIDVLNTAVAEFSSVLSVNEATLNKKIPEEAVNIVGDQDRLKDVFKNLLANGIEAMSDCPEKVMHIDLVISDNHNQAELSFSDTGCGIFANRIEEIFEPYITYKKHGTGLGLAIVQEILAEHGGTIKVTSTPGHGSCFLLTLPLSPA